MTTEGEIMVLEHATLGRLEFAFNSSFFWNANTTASFGTTTIPVSISFFHSDPTIEALDLVASEVPELSAWDERSRRALALVSDESASFYVQAFKKCLFEELDPETLTRHFGVAKRAEIDDVRFIECLQLVEFSVIFDGDGPSFMCEYSVERDVRAGLTASFWTSSEGQNRISFGCPLSLSVKPKMAPVTLEHRTLGHLEFDADGFAATQLELAEAPIPVDIQFERQPTKKRLDTAARLLADLPTLDQRARAAISDQLARGNEDDAAPLYKSHHAEELSDATLLDDPTFLARLQLVRVGVDIEKRGGSVECDYSLGTEATQYVLSVRFAFSGRLREIAFES